MNKQDALQAVRSGLAVNNYLEKSKTGLYNCPYCGSGTGKNRTGAVKVYPETNTWHCFSCDKTGDVIDLIQQKTGADFNRAIEYGAQALGISIDKEPIKGKTADLRQEKMTDDKLYLNSNKTPTSADLRPHKGILEAEYTAYIEKCKRDLNDNRAISYLTARGISEATAARHNIGFDPEADPAGSGHKTPRIIIPTAAGHYIGRSIDPNTPKEYAKMNNKGATPGLFNAEALYTAGPVFIAEGAFDALAIEEAGAAAVALNSTSNAKALVKQLQERPTDAAIILCLDNDEAGRKRSAELLQALQALYLNCSTADICGQYKDPNEALTKDRSAFIKAVQYAQAAAVPDELAVFLEQIQAETYKPSSTGLLFLDDLLSGGMIKQTLSLLMAAPGTGKTTLCQQAAEAIAAQGNPVIFLNLEMSKEQMLAKAISGRLAQKGIYIDALKVLQGYTWTEYEKGKITAEVENYRQSIYRHLRYNPAGIGSDLDKILEYLDRTGETARAAGKPAPAVILDYLHLVSTSRGLDAQELIKQAVTGLKNYAIKYDTFIIAIVAVNRESMKKGQLSMNSGRDSSNIEYAADYIITLNYYDFDQGKKDPQKDSDLAELQAEKWRRMILRLPKSRYGQPGKTAQVYFNAAANYFLPVNGFIPDGAAPFDDPFTTPPAKRI